MPLLNKCGFNILEGWGIVYRVKLLIAVIMATARTILVTALSKLTHSLLVAPSG